MKNPKNRNFNTNKSHTHNLFKAAILALGIVLAMGAASLPAAARGVPATGAIALPASDIDCFSEFYGSYRNVCASTKLLRFSLSVDSGGPKDVWVIAEGASPNNNVGCEAIGINSSVTSYWGSPKLYLSSFGSTQTIYLNGAYVNSFGALYVNCWLNNGGRVNSVSYVH